jgi:hypothetical protein
MANSCSATSFFSFVFSATSDFISLTSSTVWPRQRFR